MIESGGLEKKIRVSSYNVRGQLAMESVFSVEMEDEDEWAKIQRDVRAGHAEMGLTVEIVELTERQWHTSRLECAFDLPEWQENECPEHIPERIGTN